tara:strand:+ start:103 stop:258 length:156 start_codon:yes stop_codon:yes gene_type:complete
LLEQGCQRACRKKDSKSILEKEINGMDFESKRKNISNQPKLFYSRSLSENI